MLRTYRSVLLVVVCAAVAAATTAGLNRVAAQGDAKEESGKVLRHVVFFGFKAGATAEQIKEVEVAFEGLKDKIDVIQDFEWGTNVSPEKLDQGHSHCFFITFKDAAGRDAYLVHPDHKAFAGMLGPVLEKVTVIDYWTKE
ncbi:MAG: hypothetical protein AMXMBFR84_08530 [Candidatus Hydrogenedentota bacterium]